MLNLPPELALFASLLDAAGLPLRHPGPPGLACTCPPRLRRADRGGAAQVQASPGSGQVTKPAMTGEIEATGREILDEEGGSEQFT